ncbi:uncharacterized protein TNCV_4737801 [Trichonephila clavipes]|nr:uncharacterized protein TNCV_4737801 [Trichonephila clavipes]
MNRDLLQMIASFINDTHETWDQFLREFAYALLTAVHETIGKTLAELFLGRKLVMVLYGAEFVVGNIEKLFKEDRQNTRVKHEKWAKYYNKKRRDVNIKAGRRATVNIDQVRIYHQRKSDERVIEVESSVRSGLDYQSSSSEENRPILDQSQGFRSSESGERRGEQEKKISLTGNQGGRQIELPKKLSLDLQEERCKSKGDQSGSEENYLGGQARTTRVDTPVSSPNKRVSSSRNRVRGMEDPVIIFPNKANTPDSKETNGSPSSRRSA